MVCVTLWSKICLMPSLPRGRPVHTYTIHVSSAGTYTIPCVHSGSTHVMRHMSALYPTCAHAVKIDALMPSVTLSQNSLNAEHTVERTRTHVAPNLHFRPRFA